MTASDPRVKFAVRYPAGGGRWRYQSLIIANPGGSAFTPMAHPPAAGDLISLWDQFSPQPEGGPVFLVIARMWCHSSYGSADWPYGKSEAQSGPLLDIIVEPAESAFRDETPICEEPSCEAVWMNGAWWMPPGADEPDPHEHAPYSGNLADLV